jgi:hypothetical protein
LTYPGGVWYAVIKKQKKRLSISPLKGSGNMAKEAHFINKGSQLAKTGVAYNDGYYKTTYNLTRRTLFHGLVGCFAGNILLTSSRYFLPNTF